MNRTKTIALVLGPTLAVLALLAGYFWKDHAQKPGMPLQLHSGAADSSQVADVAASAGSLSPLEPKPQDLTGTPDLAGSQDAGVKDKAQPEKSQKPQFDVVRVEPKGDVVVAGHGEAHANVEVLSNGKVIAQGKADAAGQFVLIPPQLAPGDHDLALRATPLRGATVDSDQRVAVYVPREKGEEAAVALAEPGKPTVLLKDPTAAAEKALPDAAEAKPSEALVPSGKTADGLPSGKTDVPPKSEAKGPEAPREKAAKAEAKSKDAKVLESKPGDSKSSDSKSGDSKPAVAIKTAEVVEPGGFFATGQAAPGAHIRLYLNGSVLADVIAGKDGHWSVKVGKGLIPGQYAVRADQVDGKGQVSARAEVTFLYKNEPKLAEAGSADAPQPGAKPQDAAGAAAPAAPEITASTKGQSAPQAENAMVENAVVAEIQTTTVEKGNSLWRISRATLGRGTRYTEIYAANATQIRDPKLIYPGQVFVIPGQIN